ncbi:hypothetical protein BgAZ_104230 [Babesia gibsoni]|uniref:Uncharacterized protein n=1 Tax=Babesia gibsoni TaxID=33632 RepID=A0AAD8PFW7_BABGI|nr:hypothetical protein BgAZ_104230 [Babesia gibsoni]
MKLCFPRLAATVPKAFTEHGGWKIQVALCVDRQPTEFVESEYDAVYRQFFESWCRTTKNQLKVPKLATIESKITHKIVPSKEDHSTVVKEKTEDSYEPTGELESLLAAEIKLTPTRRRTQSTQESTVAHSKINVDEDIRNVDRLAQDWLFLVVKHRNFGWMLPTADLYHGEGLRQTLKRICEVQLGQSYKPYFLGYAPFLHRTFPFKSEQGQSDILGNKG